ncbi:MAG: SulP family inorganic anion transporter, partial [Candidatus Eremiobacteraeota bacterium]|nr:SulP family inorganic anion transporter [Candidatus Eremiobacteraeota bacterium]
MLAAIALPESLATSRLAGFSPEVGLVAFAAGVIGFALLGRNRFLSVGADSTIAPIFATTLAGIAASLGIEYAQLAGWLALIVGGFLILAALLRAGWIADLLSVPVTTGVLAGIGVHIIVGQLPSLLGLAEMHGALVVRLWNILKHLGDANPYSAAVGFSVVAVTLIASRVSNRIPGALIGLVGAGIAVAVLDLPSRGVAVLGKLDTSAPRAHLTPIDLSEAVALFPLALVLVAVCMLQSSAVLRSFPSDPEQSENISSDFGAIGAGNILAAFLGAFPVNS